MKISLITTVKNEEKNIKRFLDSIVNQTKIPNEFIIVDGGSKDKTWDIAKSYKNKHNWIKLFSSNLDIGSARNLAIKKAKNRIIVSIDAGGYANKTWLEEIISPFKNPKIDVVSGVYKPLHKNFFEYCQGIIVCKPIEKINEKNFLPSSRSFAFKKEAWKIVGRYPKYYTGEDTAFVLNLKEKGFKFALARKAIVYWEMRPNWKSFAKQFYKYAQGDVKTGNLIRMKKNFIFILFSVCYPFLLISSYLINLYLFVGLLFITSVYFIKPGLSIFLKTGNFSGIFYGSLLLFIKRVSYVFGIIVEITHKRL